MLFATVALISALLAAAARRPLRRLLEYRFRRMEILALAVLLHLAFVPPALSPLLSTPVMPGFLVVGGLAYILSLSLLVVFTWVNWRIPGVLLIGIGLFMNTLVIGANGGQMPVEPGQLATLGKLLSIQEAEAAGQWSSYRVMQDGTNLPFLGDRFPFPRPLIEPVVLSPGDLVILLGIFQFFLMIPVPRSSEWRIANSE